MFLAERDQIVSVVRSTLGAVLHMVNLDPPEAAPAVPATRTVPAAHLVPDLARETTTKSVFVFPMGLSSSSLRPILVLKVDQAVAAAHTADTRAVHLIGSEIAPACGTSTFVSHEVTERSPRGLPN